MRKKIIWIIIFFSFILVIFVVGFFASSRNAENQAVVHERIKKHQEDVNELNERLQIEKKAYQKEKSGDYKGAIDLFEKVLVLAGNSSASSPARLALERNYEKIGQYSKALDQVEWFLRGNQSEQGREETLKIKTRLLAAQKQRDHLE